MLRSLATLSLATLSLGSLLTACADPVQTVQAADPADAVIVMPEADGTALVSATDAQPDDIKTRYTYRHPVETLSFIGINPGMTVIDALPGSKGEGWYTPILARYLGSGDRPGRLIGMDYDIDMWAEFGGFATPDFIAAKRSWADEWVAGSQARLAAGDFGDADVAFDALTFNGDTAPLAGKADAALFMRALHNLARFEDRGGYLSTALSDTYTLLKPGGIVGVVQHRAPADAIADWADGSNGYLKQADVIAAFEAAGFEFVKSSEINANAADVPTSDDIVWRLPPSLNTSRDDADLRARMQAIGESDRMTLVFRKPG